MLNLKLVISFLMFAIVAVAGYIIYLVFFDKEDKTDRPKNKRSFSKAKPIMVAVENDNGKNKFNGASRANYNFSKETNYNSNQLATSVPVKRKEDDKDEPIKLFAKRRLQEIGTDSDFNADKVVFYTNILKSQSMDFDTFLSLSKSVSQKYFIKEVKNDIINDVKLLRSLNKKKEARDLINFFIKNQEMSDEYLVQAFKNTKANIASEACSRALSEYLLDKEDLSNPAKKVLMIVLFEAISKGDSQEILTDDEQGALKLICEIL